VWSWWHSTSIHRSKWPTPEEVVKEIGGDDPQAVNVIAQTQLALGEVRRIKALQKRPVKAVIESAVLPQHYAALQPASRDFCAATHIRELSFGDIAEPELTFAAEPTAEPRV
jgi:valyl-tRNA synthetase